MDHDVNQRLVEAVNAGDDVGVRQALSLGADPNVAAGRFRGPVLSQAAASGHLLIVRAAMQGAAPAALRILLDHGAEPDQRRSDGTPVLVLAARRGDHAAVDALLHAGADVDASDPRGRTALMHAVERDERAVAAVLRLAGATIDKISSDGTTALELARGWQRQNIQLMLGERIVGLDDVPITRTVIRLHPTGHQLRGDPTTFRLWAQVIECAVNTLGTAEWKMRTGITSEKALGVAERLRHEPEPTTNASWYVLDVTSGELAAVRAARSFNDRYLNKI